MIRRWLQEWWYIGGFLMLSIVIAIVVFMVMPVQAAQPAPPTVTACVTVAKTATIEVYRCMDEDMGNVLYLNNLGFMLPWEQ